MANTAENSISDEKQYQKALRELNNAIDRVKINTNIKNDTIKRTMISDLFFDFIKQNFTEDIKSTELINKTGDIIKTHPESAFGIVTSFTQDRIAKRDSLKEIGKSISKIIQNKGIKNQELLVKKIIFGFVKGCLMREPDNIEDIKTGFNNLLKGTGYERVYNLEVIIDSFYNQYKENLDNLKKEIKNITKGKESHEEKEKLIGDSFFDFILHNVQEKKEPQLLIETASEIIKNNQEFAFAIIEAFTAGFICKGKDLEDIAGYISQIIKNDEQIIKNNKEAVLFYIINGFANAFFKKSDDIGSLVNKISKITENHPEFAFELINVFTQELVCKEKDLKEIGGYSSQIIQHKGINNQDLANKIICGFVQGYLQQKKDDINNLTDEISKIIENNKKLASGISAGFTQGCFFCNKEWKDIDSRISQFIKNNGTEYNSNLVNDIINGFTQGCIIAGRKLKDIGNGISNIINTEGITNSQNLVSKIISGFTQGYFINNKQSLKGIGNGISEIIINNTESTFEIINGFTHGYFVNNKQRWEGIENGIKEIINAKGIKNNKELKSNINNAFEQIKHRINIFTNISNRQLSRKDKQCKEGADYRSPQPYQCKEGADYRYPQLYCPLSNIYAKSNKSSELEKKKDLNNGKPEYDSISNIEEKIESFIDEILKQRNKQDNNSRQK